jgi:osmotically-inducible protein OsmY
MLLEEPAFEYCAIEAGSEREIQPALRTPPAPEGWINIDVEDGVVTLNGQVPSLAHKRLAGALAWWVPGSRDVINGLEEVPPEEDNDNELTEAVRLVLEKDPLVKARPIAVSCKGAVVTLEGVVHTEVMKQMAERDAWYVLGVRDVVNRIGVQP